MGELPLSPARVLGVVLAAGSGTRMGTPKAQLVVAGVRLLDFAVVALRNGGCDRVAAVLPVGAAGAHGALTVENPASGTGMRSSLVAALTVAAGFDALCVTLVDTPGVGADAVATVVEAWRSSPGVFVAVYNGRRGHPTVMSVERWAAAVAVAGPDEGARAYLRAHASDVVEVPVTGDPADLDTPADLAHWLDRRR